MRIEGTRAAVCGALVLFVALPATLVSAPPEVLLPVEEFELDNGMRFLMLERPDMPTVEAGWVVDVGAADDPADSTGLSHFIEHMLFKGTHTLGSRAIDRELEVLDRLARVEDALAALPASGRKAARQRSALASEQGELAREARELTQLGAFSLEYSRAGATRLNANTAEDLTLYYVTLPAPTLELWFWLESDRLRQPVFREFLKEKQVVAEERRQRVDSTPTGSADREFERVFWQQSSYAQPALGTSEHLERVSRRQLVDFFTHRYRPGNLTAVLVGNFDPDRVRRLAQAYFGRIDGASAHAATEAAAPAQPEPQRTQEERLTLACRCAPQVRVRYPTVPFGHEDQFALQTLAGLLNGRHGRLYRNLVLGEEIAFAAFAQQTPLRRAGTFGVTLEAKAGSPGSVLLAAWDEQLALLIAEPPTAAELSRVRRRLATQSLNQLKDPHLLMRRLLVYAGLGDWRQLAGWTERLAEVDATAVTDVAERYLRPERRLVGFYQRSEAGQ